MNSVRYILVWLAFMPVVTTVSAEDGEMRDWTSRKGTQIRASFLEERAGRVSLKGEDGKTMQIHLSSLSSTDQEYLSERKARLEQKENEELSATNLERLGLMTGQQVMELEGKLAKLDAVNSKYLLYLPEGYGAPGKKWPLMLFLHGKGECGDDPNRVKAHGPPMLLARNQKAFPCVVVSPQCRPGRWWMPSDVMALVEHVEAMLSIDETRIYVTGLSMGGFGSWGLITSFPNKFAAAIPICGGGNPGLTQKIKNLPIWAFHGDADDVVPVDRSRSMVEALKKHGSDVKYTEYPGVNHNSWSKTYDNQEVYDWLFKQKK